MLPHIVDESIIPVKTIVVNQARSQLPSHHSQCSTGARIDRIIISIASAICIRIQLCLQRVIIHAQLTHARPVRSESFS